jgi:outer membrane protein OmpA-like peptidoglycan-associated protein
MFGRREWRIRTPFREVTLRIAGALGERAPGGTTEQLIGELSFELSHYNPEISRILREALDAVRGVRTFSDAAHQSARLNAELERELRAAVRSGRLELAEVQRSKTVARRAPSLAPALGPEPEEKEELGRFEVRFVDETGQAIDGLEVLFNGAGVKDKQTTDGGGVARFNNVPGSFGSVSIVSIAALGELLDIRWQKPRVPVAITDANKVESVFTRDLSSFSLEATKPLTVVLKPALGRLSVELWEKTGRIRHANCDYEIAGPESFEGTTDEDGRLLHEEVFPGDYTLTLKVDVNRPRAKARPGEEPRPHEPKLEEYESPLVALESGNSAVQLRMIGVLPRVVMARMRGMLFDTNKCFLLPTAIEAVQRIREIYEANNPSELLVVGHTDTTAEPAINDPLSVERAKSVKAYLEDDVDTWLKNYDLPGKKKWGSREDRLMIIAMPDFGSRQPSEDLVKWFQGRRGLTVDGIAGPKTRKQLIADYMAIDGVKLADQKHFHVNISAHGAGENFPLDATGLALDSAAADAQEDRVDRRVELFFFDKEFGVEPPPGSADGPEYLEWRARAAETEDHEVAGIQNELTIVPIESAHFRTGSAVLLPEGEAPTTDVGTATTSVGALAMALRFNEEHPGQSVLVAGHTDSVGSDANNDKLSSQRAQVVHAVLTGDREAFVSIADETGKVSDWKQILSWASIDLAVLFPLRASDDKGPASGPVLAQVSFAECDPGVIDDNAFTGVEPVKAFQRAFNANKATLASTADDLKVDGAFGKKSWGAVFDCYQYNMARELGADPDGVQALRDQLVFLPTKKPFVGFGEHHPADGNTADAVASQANRRVEVLFFDKGQEPDVALIDEAPEITELYLPDVYRKQELPQRPGGAKQHPLFAVSLLDIDGTQLVRAEGIRYTVKQAGEVLADEISQDGFGQFRVPPDVTSNVQVTWQPDADGPIFSRTIALQGALQTGGKAVENARLAALGYPFAEGTPQERVAAVQAFQRDYLLGTDPVTAGALPSPISAKLTQAFEADFEAPIPPPPDDENDDGADIIDIDDDDELPTLAADSELA